MSSLSPFEVEGVSFRRRERKEEGREIKRNAPTQHLPTQQQLRDLLDLLPLLRQQLSRPLVREVDHLPNLVVEQLGRLLRERLLETVLVLAVGKGADRRVHAVCCWGREGDGSARKRGGGESASG